LFRSLLYFFEGFFCGTGGRTRTDTLFRAADFESAASAIPPLRLSIMYLRGRELARPGPRVKKFPRGLAWLSLRGKMMPWHPLRPKSPAKGLVRIRLGSLRVPIHGEQLPRC